MRQVAETLGQQGKGMAAKVREVMAEHAARMIGEGQKGFLVAGLREVEHALGSRGEQRSWLPQGDETRLSDQEVVDAFADFGAEYLGGGEGKSGVSREADGKVRGTKIGPVLDALARVMQGGLRRAAPAERSSYADGSLIELYDNPALKRTAEDRRAEWARLFARIPEGQAWVSSMLKIRGNEAFHEILRKAGALIDLVFKIDLSKVEDKFQTLLFTETERREKKCGNQQSAAGHRFKSNEAEQAPRYSRSLHEGSAFSYPPNAPAHGPAPSSARPCQPFTWLIRHLSAEPDFTKQVRNATCSPMSPQEIMASLLHKQNV